MILRTIGRVRTYNVYKNITGVEQSTGKAHPSEYAFEQRRRTIEVLKQCCGA